MNAPKLAGHISSNMRSTAMPRKEEARLGFADLPRWMQEHHLAKQGKTVKQGTPKEEVAVKKRIAVKHENVVEKENKVETAPVAEKDGPANMHLFAEVNGENTFKKEASPVTKSALLPHLRPASLSASGPAKQSIATEAKELEKLNLTTQAGEPEKKSLTIEADAPAPLSKRSSNAAISTSETNKVTLPADFMARWLSNKKAAATSTPEQSSTLIHDPAPAQELEDAQRCDSKPDTPPASALGSPATKPVESSTLTSNDTPSTAKPSTNTVEVEEDRTNAQTFSSWGTVEVRDRPGKCLLFPSIYSTNSLTSCQDPNRPTQNPPPKLHPRLHRLPRLRRRSRAYPNHRRILSLGPLPRRRRLRQILPRHS